MKNRLNTPDRRQLRLYDSHTRQFLHRDGIRATESESDAWLGLPSQANILQQRAEIRGENWPYKLRHRTPANAPLPPR